MIIGAELIGYLVSSPLQTTLFSAHFISALRFCEAIISVVMVPGAAVLAELADIFGVVEIDVGDKVVDGIVVDGLLLDVAASTIFWLGSLFKRFSCVTYKVTIKKNNI